METHVALVIAVAALLVAVLRGSPAIAGALALLKIGPRRSRPAAGHDSSPSTAEPAPHCVFCWDAITHEHALSGAGTCAAHAREGVPSVP